ncbi:hypothetical protein BCR32DRAFT_292278 [Anaeromyces robustus]|uniref:Uncharacterized protein n=1 Tax=Anaeromyces robustus TaxID=1754192 RepID=A0A1Y1XBF0_9FUNG|nr:hypothetical protein BCR32DRAFT_292278 [Anaeromyces robustus]|eukprot:ORX83045.1 hypothetical protein BCR32DRAFT_292278 [Anaeromyces robustus]
MSNNRNQYLDDYNIADPDQILLSIFKSTATTVTQLYKESLNQSTKSYKNGYKQCLLDLMHFASLQQHQREINNNSRQEAHNPSQGNRVALTFDELLNFYNTKQQQINSLDDNSNSNSSQQNVNHSSSMSNDDDSPIENNIDKINNYNYQETNESLPSPQPQTPTNIDTIPTTEKNTIITNDTMEKPNLVELKSTLNNLPTKGFTFRFNNDQFSTNFNNINIINNSHHNSHHEGMKRRFGNVANTINFFGKTYNFDNIDNFENVEEPPFKRNRWRRDDRMID